MSDSYIYETPDGGKTVYRRSHGHAERELVTENHYQQSRLHRQLWQQIHAAAENDSALKAMLDEVEIYYNLKHT